MKQRQLDYDYLERIRKTIALCTTRKTSNILDGAFRSTYHGKSMEFDDLKEYVPGDDVHDIDWRSSSRTGKTLVRRYIAQRKHNILFVCDTGLKMCADTPSGESKSELAMMTFGTVAYLVNAQGADYALAYSTQTGREISAFRSGPGHLEELMYGYRGQIEEKTRFSLRELLDQSVDLLQRRMVIVIVTDTDGLASLDDAIMRRLTIHCDVLVYHIEDAFLTGDSSYDLDGGRYVEGLLSHNRRLYEAERAQRAEILQHAEELGRRYQMGLTTIRRGEEIIDATAEMFEKRKQMAYGNNG